MKKENAQYFSCVQYFIHKGVKIGFTMWLFYRDYLSIEVQKKQKKQTCYIGI